MRDDFTFFGTPIERMGERTQAQRPADAALAVERSPAVLEAEARDHEARADSLKRQSDQAVLRGNIVAGLSVVALADAQPEIGIPLGIVAVAEYTDAAMYNQQSNSEADLAKEKRAEAEQARADEARKTEQERQQREFDRMDRVIRGEIDRQMERGNLRDLPDVPRDPPDRMSA
jgi:hypothetical protein